jgi:hypothetical protein
MYITISTPAYKDADGTLSYFPAHLVEHCVGVPYPMDEAHFFSSVIDSDRDFFESYTRYYFPDTHDIDTCIAMLISPISPDVYIHELKLILLELEEKNNGCEGKILVALGEALYGHTAPTSTPITISYNDLTAYHQRYYTQDNMCITDNDFTPISVGKNLLQPSLVPVSEVSVWREVTYENFLVDETTYCVVSLPYRSWKHYMSIYYIYHVINEYLRWSDRYLHMSRYTSRQVAYVKMSRHWSVLREEDYTNDILQMPLSFFTHFQQYYRTSCHDTFDAYRNIINIVHGIQNPTDIEIQNFIGEMSYEGCMLMLRGVVSKI